MATALPSFCTPVVCSTAPPNPRKPDATYKWWAPIFGLSPDSGYVTPRASDDTTAEASPGTGRVRPDRSFFIGCFTEEKAKELRRKTSETSTFHDIMYHSAIASRLASDVSGR